MIKLFTDIAFSTGDIAKEIASITIIGGALIWLYNILIAKPNRKLEGKLMESTIHLLKETIDPLTTQVKELNTFLTESKEDRKRIHEILNEHNKTINDHEKRIYRMEDNK